MTERLNNDFQFLDVGREGPKKIKASVRKNSTPRFMSLIKAKRLQSSPIVV